MNSYLGSFFLFILSLSLFSQNVKDRIQGEWICTGIYDRNGTETSGRFGHSSEYLKFTFKKSNINIVKAPFDAGRPFPIAFKNDNFDLMPQSDFEYLEMIYRVIDLSDTNLILQTNRADAETLTYHFVKLKTWEQPRLGPNQLVDNGLIIVKHLQYKDHAYFTDKSFEYAINNLSNYPTPVFNHIGAKSFGEFVSQKFTFPRAYHQGYISQQLIVDFDVDEKGISKIKFGEGFNHDIKNHMMRVIQQSSKHWIPLHIDGKVQKTTVRFHFIFYLAKVELE